MLGEANLKLHKFVSHDKEVIGSIPPEERSQVMKNLNLCHDNLPMETALGIQRNIEIDCFTFRITLKDKPLTRRGILSTVSSVYDPLGFVAPVLLKGRQILQEICREQGDWDEPVGSNIRSQWEQWRSKLIDLERVHIDRCYKPVGFGDVRKAELHHFSDASTIGYGQCTYLRLVDDLNRVHCSFVMGKSRVCPAKLVTIPRLELTAAVLSVKISTLIKRELNYGDISEVFWTDSKVILGYISNESRKFHVFVANRVQQIRNCTDPSQWRYIRSAENPADEASRGLNSYEFPESKWLKGPSFLWEPCIPEASESIVKLEVDDPEGLCLFNAEPRVTA